MADKSTVRKPALGRGLSSLLAQAEATYAQGASNSETSYTVPLEKLAPGKFQPRRRFDAEAIEQLSQSIKARGILQPILARRIDGDRYEIIAGERRWRAAQLAGLHEAPVLLRDFSDGEALEIGLIENLQRQDLNALEEAEAYKRLMDEFGHNQQALAETIGKSRSHIANTLRLLSLPDTVKTMVVTDRLSAGHARAVLGSPDPAALAEEIVSRGLSVREAERLAAATPGKTVHVAKKPRRSTDIAAIESDLALRLGMRVQVQAEGNAGRLTIHFQSLDQFDDLLTRLSRSD